jgi:hypothetical protein
MRAVFALCLLGLPLACARADGQSRLTGAPEGPVVIELFTSQGCSSCPPAEALLAKLANVGAVGDRKLAPLSFHVDYWDGMGWADPYALPAWTARQHQYARALSDDRVYTPELVVGGAAGMVGSHRSAVVEAIERAARPALLPATATWTKNQVTVTATAPAGTEVWVAVWEDGTPNKVTRGENAGETMRGDRVVRRLERVVPTQGAVSIKLDPSWRAGGAVAFAHGPDRRIVASALLPLTSPQPKPR